MKLEALKRKWHKDLIRDDVREMNMDEERLNRCPHIRTLRGGDETQDMCDLVDKWCLIEHGGDCEEWDKIKDEWDAEYGEHPRPWDKLKEKK
ncbi:hypothetical protein LCGC14_0384700 [marine sediment metagenome]|uniref:Uncharacterized protein n=1 Tax=marine sediment metagenome TaxID=412755 RepID=A0A0F9WA33_9ZZZZ